VNKKMAWRFAFGVTTVLAVGAAVLLAGHSGGEPRHATSTRGTAPAATSRETAGNGTGVTPPASPATAATAAQVQQVLARIMTRIPQATAATNGVVRAQTPAEVEAELRVELAKIGLHP